MVVVEIKNINSNDLRTADIALKTNNHDVEINDFTQGILKETIFAIVNTLKIDTEIKDIKIGDFYNLQEQKSKLKELVLKKYDDLDAELLDEYLDFCLFSNTENDKKIEKNIQKAKARKKTCH